MTAVAATARRSVRARMMTGNLPVVPSRASLSASGRAAAASTIHNNAAQHFSGRQARRIPTSSSRKLRDLQQSMQQNHVSAVTPGARSENMESRGGTTAGAGKPSAGTPASKGMGGSATQALVPKMVIAAG